MNRSQRAVLACGAALCLLVLLFPSFGRATAASIVPQEGRTFVLSSGFGLRKGLIAFDNSRTLIELLGIALATGLGFVATTPGKG